MSATLERKKEYVVKTGNLFLMRYNGVITAVGPDSVEPVTLLEATDLAEEVRRCGALVTIIKAPQVRELNRPANES